MGGTTSEMLEKEGQAQREVRSRQSGLTVGMSRTVHDSADRRPVNRAGLWAALEHAQVDAVSVKSEDKGIRILEGGAAAPGHRKALRRADGGHGIHGVCFNVWLGARAA